MTRPGIVVLHGVGTQKKGEMINDIIIIEPLACFLQRFSGRPGHPHILRRFKWMWICAPTTVRLVRHCGSK